MLLGAARMTKHCIMVLHICGVLPMQTAGACTPGGPKGEGKRPGPGGVGVGWGM